MKKYLLLTLGLLVFGAAQSQAQVITGFGTAGLNPINTTTDLFAWAGQGSVNTTSLIVTNVANTGAPDIFQILTTPVADPATSRNYLTLEGTLVSKGVNFSSGSFRITLFDSSFNSLVYNFNYNSFSSVESFASVGLDTIDSSGLFNGTVSSWELDGGGTSSDTMTFNFDQLTAAPEPSTYAMFGFGLFMLYFVYRRKAKTIRAYSIPPHPTP